MDSNGKWHICLSCGLRVQIPASLLGPGRMPMHLGCQAYFVPEHPRGLDVFGSVVMYERNPL